MLNASINALLISSQDNVAVALVALHKGQCAVYSIPGTNMCGNTLLNEDVPVYHKFSIRMIEKNANIYKYGEIIGTAYYQIEEGQHVHLHNVLDKRGQLVLEGKT